jgi:hypothetical protein
MEIKNTAETGRFSHKAVSLREEDRWQYMAEIRHFSGRGWRLSLGFRFGGVMVMNHPRHANFSDLGSSGRPAVVQPVRTPHRRHTTQ